MSLLYERLFSTFVADDGVLRVGVHLPAHIVLAAPSSNPRWLWLKPERAWCAARVADWERAGLIEASRGPRGGKGWRLTPAGARDVQRWVDDFRRREQRAIERRAKRGARLRG